ncbi:MAG: cation-translocating P-type ATPase [Eubacteriales bacterium]|nr:cation-translocating P-type ATPase [Eubacteriales bacterium]
MKRFSLPLLWTAGLLIACAAVMERTAAPAAAVSALYLAAFALSGATVMLRAVQALRFRTVSIELLVSIAAVGAALIEEYSESAVVTFLFQFGSYLEQKTMKKTRSAIKALTELAPTTAWRVISDGENGEFETEEIDADEAAEGDILLVKAGGRIAADGVVTRGEGYVGEAGITGEPMAKHKSPGDILYAGTIMESGSVHMRASRVGEDTTFARIIALVEEAQDAKSPVERFIDRFARYYTPAVVVIAAAVLIFTGSVETAITVLVLACPGALVIGAPIANVAGIGRGAQEGILLKGGESIHVFAKTDTLVFDKTGTLTEGVPEVCARRDYSDGTERALSLTASAERASEHPLAGALVRYADGLPSYAAESVETVRGCGVEAMVCGCRVLAGNRRLMEKNGVSLTPQLLRDMDGMQDAGASTVIIAVDGRAELLLGISDGLKPDAEDSVRELRALGISELIMLTGDNSRTAKAISERLSLTDFRAELLPEDKLTVIRELQSAGRVVTFVGDGINDSPALAAADTGIAMGSGTDAAIDSSDVVLIRSDLTSLVRALSLSRRTVRILYENIALAVGTVALLLIGLFAGFVHMSLGMLIHEASILAVTFNAMRLLIPPGAEKERRK